MNGRSVGRSVRWLVVLVGICFGFGCFCFFGGVCLVVVWLLAGWLAGCLVGCLGGWWSVVGGVDQSY